MSRCVHCSQQGIAGETCKYNPTGHQTMHLDGKTCADCVHTRRCVLMFGKQPTDTECDWFPIRFSPRFTFEEIARSV